MGRRTVANMHPIAVAVASALAAQATVGAAATPQDPVSFKVSLDDRKLIDQIAERGAKVAKKMGIKYERLHIEMDVCAVHANGNPLRLKALLSAPDFDFNHDIFGIMNCLDRETGKLTRCFSPRYSLPATASARKAAAEFDAKETP